MSQPKSGNPGAGASPWSPLRISIFRNLLIANLVSDVGAFMQSVGAAWRMTSLTSNPLYVALIQTASALPFFLLALPAGAIGDIVDRRRLILAHGNMDVTGCQRSCRSHPRWNDDYPERLLLMLTLAVSLGDAIETPSWRAIFPELVNKEELTPALALNGIEFNLARAVGPGPRRPHRCGRGSWRRFPGECAVISWSHLRRRHLETSPSKEQSAGGNFERGRFLRGIRYIRYSPDIRTLNSCRSACVIFFTSAFWALLPAVGKDLSKSPLGYGFLLGFFGAGCAVLGAIVLQRAQITAFGFENAAFRRDSGIVQQPSF